jgi:hypothetical protein
MTLNDQLKRAFDTLTDRLRDEVARQVSAALDELAESARLESDAARRQVDDVQKQVDDARREADEARRNAEESKRHGEDARREADEAKRQVDDARRDAEDKRRQVDEATQYAEYAKRQIDEAKREAEDAKRQADDARREVDEARRDADESKRHVEAARQEAEVAKQQIDEAKRTADESQRQADDMRRDAEEARRRAADLQRNVEEAKRQADEALASAFAAATPRAVAALHAPQDTSASERMLEAVRAMDSARSLTGVLEALLSASAHDGAGAGIWLARGSRLQHWRSAGIEHPDAEIGLDEPRAIADAARTATSAWDEGFAVPLVLAGQPIAVLYVVSQTSQVASHEVEILARHASIRLEALTAFKTARAMADRATSTAASPADAHGGALDAEDHVSAQRYARLLISEIKLYHEQAVIEGRRDRDLATRLGGEIARARVMYEQRVPVHVRQRSDHFRDELVRTLADGDASLLEMRV